MSGNVIDSLLVALGFQVDATELDEFKEKVKDARGTLLSITGAAAGAATAIGGFVAVVAQGLDDLGDWSEQEQVAAGFMQEMGHAAQMNGSDFNRMKASIEGVNRVIGEAALGIGRGAMTFEKLGLKARNAEGQIKTVDELLGEVADKMQGMSRREAIAMAEKLGIDRSLIPLLMKGRDAIAAYRAEARALGIATDEDIERAGAFQDSMDRTRFMLGAMARSIAMGLMPRVGEVLEGFRKWVLLNREVIASGVGAALSVVSTIIGRLWDLVVGLVGAVTDAVKWVSQFKVVVYAAGAALAFFVAAKTGAAIQAMVVLIRAASVWMMAFAMSATLIPALIGAIAIAVGLLVDDFMAWKEGGDSVIGDLIEKFPQLGNVIMVVEEAVRGLFGFFAGLWSAVGPPVMRLIEALWNLTTTVVSVMWPIVKPVLWGFAFLIGVMALAVTKFVGLLLWAAAHIVGFFTGIVGSIVNGITAAISMVMGFIDKVSGAVRKIGSYLGLTDANVSATITQSSAAPQASAPARGVLGKAAGGTTTSASTTNTNVNAPITIVTNDPDRAGKSVREELNRVNRQATRNGQSAVSL